MEVDARMMPLLYEERALSKDLDRARKMAESTRKRSDKRSEERWSRIAAEPEGELRELRREIVEVARRVLPRFDEIVKALGLGDNDVNALAALAGLLVYLDYPEDMPMSIRRKINYMGLFKAKGDKGRRRKKCNRRPTGYLNTLTMTIMWKNNDRRVPRLRDLKSMLKRLIRIANALNGPAMAGGLG